MHQFYRLQLPHERPPQMPCLASQTQGGAAVLHREVALCYLEHTAHQLKTWHNKVLPSFLWIPVNLDVKPKPDNHKKFKAIWVKRKVTLPIITLISSQWQGPLNPKECFCHSSTLSQYRIMLWEYHLVEAVTRAVTTVAANIGGRGDTKKSHKLEEWQFSLSQLNFT